MTKNITPELGFDIRKALQDAKFKFDAAGYEGRVSFIKATIRQGITFPLRIIDEAARVAGNHVREEIEFLIDEAENEHWGRTQGGELYVLGE